MDDTTVRGGEGGCGGGVADSEAFSSPLTLTVRAELWVLGVRGHRASCNYPGSRTGGGLEVRGCPQEAIVTHLLHLGAGCVERLRHKFLGGRVLKEVEKPSSPPAQDGAERELVLGLLSATCSPPQGTSRSPNNLLYREMKEALSHPLFNSNNPPSRRLTALYKALPYSQLSLNAHSTGEDSGSEMLND